MRRTIAEAPRGDGGYCRDGTRHISTQWILDNAIDASIRRTISMHVCGHLISHNSPIHNLTNLFTNSNGCTIPAVHSIPQWLKTNGYRTPTNNKQSPFNLGFRTDLHFFEFMSANPHLAAQFNSLMSAYHQGRPSWMDANFYPVREQLLTGARNGPDDVFLVDVGGNRGHDLEEFRAKVPEASGKLILQDLPGVIEQIGQLDARIEPMAHDFWTEQPVKGISSPFTLPPGLVLKDTTAK